MLVIVRTEYVIPSVSKCFFYFLMAKKMGRVTLPGEECSKDRQAIQFHNITGHHIEPASSNITRCSNTAAVYWILVELLIEPPRLKHKSGCWCSVAYFWFFHKFQPVWPMYAYGKPSGLQVSWFFRVSRLYT